MKRTLLIIQALLLISFSTTYGQIADGISYQAVALDERGKEIAGHDINGSIIHSSQIKVRFSIISDTPDGTILYSEEHSTYTDQYGLFSLVIGHGDALSDGLFQKLTEIKWGDNKLFLKVEIDIKSRGNFKLMGIQQMMAVPFAFHALTSSSSTVNYSDILDKPDFSLVATTGSYLDLLNKPVFDGDYNTLTNKPLIPARVSDLINDTGFMTSYTETDPIWTTASANYYTRTNMQTSGGSQLHFNNITNRPTTLSGYGITDAFDGTWSGLTGKPTTITGYGITDAFNGTWVSLTGKPTTMVGYGITDAMSNTSPANGITGANISNWNTAYSWGSHVGLYRPITYVPGWSEITSNPFLFTVPANNQLIRYNTVSGRWENFTPGYLTGYTETDPLWTAASANYYTRTNMQTSGGSQLHFNNITNRPTTLSGYGITDAMGTAHAASAITVTNISNWNNAFSWGNHAGLYRPITYVPAWNEITSNPISITTPLNNQLLKYNNVSGKWENWAPNYLIAEVDGSITNEIQSLSIAGDKLSISGGNTVTLPTAGPVGPIGPPGFGGANLNFPDGFNNMMAVNNYSGGTYEVPAGKNLYITSLVEHTVFFDDNTNTRVGEFYRTREGTLQVPLIIKANWHFTGRFSGILVDAVVVPIYFAITGTTTYTVPTGKTLFIMYSYRIFNLRVQNQPVYSTSGGEVNDELFIPIIVTQGQKVSSSSLDCYVFGYLK